MDFATELMNRFVKKQTDLIAELITLKLQAEASLSISDDMYKELQSQFEGQKLEIEMVKKQNNALVDENAALKLANTDLQKLNDSLKAELAELPVGTAKKK